MIIQCSIYPMRNWNFSLSSCCFLHRNQLTPGGWSWLGARTFGCNLSTPSKLSETVKVDIRGSFVKPSRSLVLENLIPVYKMHRLLIKAETSACFPWRSRLPITNACHCYCSRFCLNERDAFIRVVSLIDSWLTTFKRHLKARPQETQSTPFKV